MAVAFRAAGTLATGTTTVVVSYPAGVASGDLLLMQFWANSGNTITTPSGWTLLTGFPVTVSGVGRIYLFYKIAGASEPSTVSVTASNQGGGIMAAFSGANTSTPIDVSGTTTLSTSGSTSGTTPSVTTTVANTMLARLYWSYGGTAITPAGTETERWEATWGAQDFHYEGATSTQAAAGASGSTTATFSSSHFGGVGATVAIAPATAVAPVADFTGTPLTGNRPLSVAFTDTSTNTPTSWDWDFGDGSSHATTQNPTHNYTSAGTYTVTLIATNAGGSNTKTRTGYVTVSNPSGTFTSIKWGDHLQVTDLGGGVIRVDYV